MKVSFDIIRLSTRQETFFFILRTKLMKNTDDNGRKHDFGINLIYTNLLLLPCLARKAFLNSYLSLL